MVRRLDIDKALDEASVIFENLVNNDWNELPVYEEKLDLCESDSERAEVDTKKLPSGWAILAKNRGFEKETDAEGPLFTILLETNIHPFEYTDAGEIYVTLELCGPGQKCRSWES
jgi:hypothetical protein